MWSSTHSAALRGTDSSPSTTITFRHDRAFQEAYARGVKAGNGVDPRFEWRVHVAFWAAAASLRVPGDFVECGVNAGVMSSAIMHRLHWNSVGRRFHLIDTFAGPVLEQYSSNEIGCRQARGSQSCAGCRCVCHRSRAGTLELLGMAQCRGCPGIGSRGLAFIRYRRRSIPAHRHELRVSRTGGAGVLLGAPVARRHRTAGRLCIRGSRCSDARHG